LGLPFSNGKFFVGKKETKNRKFRNDVIF